MLIAVQSMTILRLYRLAARSACAMPARTSMVAFPQTPKLQLSNRLRFLTHKTAASVVAPHNLWWLFIQATVAILILVGFESVTSMGAEAKNPTRHIPIAVLASLLIQGLVWYLIESFAANYFLNSGYTMQSATASAAPIGDMMIIV